MVDKKRRRRRKVPKSLKLSSTTTNLPVPEVVKNENIQKPSDTVKVVKYNYNGVDRINEIPALRSMSHSEIINNIIGKYGYSTARQMEIASEDEATPIFERIVMGFVAQALKSSDKIGSDNAKYLMDRVGGKSKEVIEHTGPVGNVVEITNNTLNLNAMSVEQLKQLKDMAIEIKKLREESNKNGD